LILTKNKTKVILEIAFEVLLSFACLVVYNLFSNTLTGLTFSILVYLIFTFLLDKNKFLAMFMRFNFKDLRFFFPILIEFVALFLYSVFKPMPQELITTSAIGWEAVPEVLANLFLMVFREEFGTSFWWLIIGLQIMNLFKNKEESLKRIDLLIFVLAVLFGLLHFPAGLNFSFGTIFENTNPLGFGFAYVFAAFCLGMYLKTLFLKTFSLPMAVLAHFTINMMRSILGFAGAIDIDTGFVVLLSVVLPLVYLIYTLIKLKKLPNKPQLQALIEGLEPVTIGK